MSGHLLQFFTKYCLLVELFKIMKYILEILTLSEIPKNWDLILSAHNCGVSFYE